VNIKKLAAFLLVLLVLVLAPPAFAQGSGLALRLSRDFGYAGFSNDIEGLYTISVDGPEDLARVDFYIDEQVMATIERGPFRYQFSTKSYEPGEHHLVAVGTTANGQELRSNEFVRVFLSAEEARSKVIGLVLPLLAAVAGIGVLSVVVPMLFGRGVPQIGKYGISGGAVCPKCGLPFPIHFLSFHAGSKNLERCPHCGKWVWVRKAKKEDLAAAEARWRGDEQVVTSETKEDRVRHQIDDSRYDK
jgi:hypothetical protein